jgi:hypothetical protein
VLLYSTNTWLALNLSARFYGGIHWVYCTQVFALMAATPHAPLQPPSSSPKNIYWELEKDVRAGDRHSWKIAQNRAGLKKGAFLKQSAGLISASDAADITWIVDNADIAQFRPLLYIISRLELHLASNESRRRVRQARSRTSTFWRTSPMASSKRSSYTEASNHGCQDSQRTSERI